MTTDIDIETVKRVHVDAAGTVRGLLLALSDLPKEVPDEAEIVDVHQYYGCDPEAVDEAEDEHEHGPRVHIALEWEVEA